MRLVIFKKTGLKYWVAAGNGATISCQKGLQGDLYPRLTVYIQLLHQNVMIFPNMTSKTNKNNASAPF